MDLLQTSRADPRETDRALLIRAIWLVACEIDSGVAQHKPAERARWPTYISSPATKAEIYPSSYNLAGRTSIAQMWGTRDVWCESSARISGM